MRALREHLRDVLAIVFAAVIALGVAGYILSNQRFYLPDWVPIAGSDFYEIEAELPTAQAVVPGQGQTVNIAGVKVGDIGRVTLEEGRAVVEMKIQRRFAPVYRDATILLRPKTGLKDMFLELDPGTKGAGPMREGERIDVEQTAPDVNPDEILASLDADTRDYLRILLDSGARALDGDAPADLRATFKRFEPTARDGERITRMLIERRRNVRRVIHNFQLLATELGSKDDQLASLIDSSNANFEAIAGREQSLRDALEEFPGALDQTATTLAGVRDLSGELGPALEALRPGARALGPALERSRPFLRTTTPVIENELRPFARDVRPTIRDLRRSANDLGEVTPALTSSFRVLNALVDTLAYNPPGAEEGFLFWAAWANHVSANIFSGQDAHGPVRRGLVLAGCPNLDLLTDVIAPANPQIGAIIELVNFPDRTELCPPSPYPPPVTASPVAGTATGQSDSLGEESTLPSPETPSPDDADAPTSDTRAAPAEMPLEAPAPLVGLDTLEQAGAGG